MIFKFFIATVQTGVCLIELPNYNTYETDDIILWDSIDKQKTIVDRKQFDEMVYGTTEPEEAFIIMMQDVYYEADSRYVFCFSSRGMPIKYL